MDTSSREPRESGTGEAASAGDLHVVRLLGELVAGTDEIVELANAGSLEEAFARIELRNECFEQLQSAMTDLRSEGAAEPLDRALTDLMLRAREAQDRLLAAISGAREGVRKEISAVDRGASVAGAYERAAGPQNGPRFQARR